MNAQVNVPIKSVLPNITLEVKITGLIKWRFQFWIAKQLFRLGALIANFNLDFKRI